MKKIVLHCCMIFLVTFVTTGCFDLNPPQSGGEKVESNTPIELPEGYVAMFNKRNLETTFQKGEQLRLMIAEDGQEREGSIYFSIRQKEKNYDLDAGYFLCVSTCPGSCKLDCQPLYDEQFKPFDRRLKSILENPRMGSNSSNNDVFYFQHQADPEIIIQGGDDDVFLIEIALAFLRLADYEPATIRFFEKMKGQNISIN